MSGINRVWTRLTILSTQRWRKHYKWSSTGDRGDGGDKNDAVIEQDLMTWMIVALVESGR